ncbi:hypothetical protein DPX16_14642 [Anabarilius grahami]|uniref:Uncharacterized protein n=1 Tax=Anabarilius grahami TaxID=495550 RepID=A0A3N0XNW4_ANAGA|nr:hypothetical protein DPX16_14642 [Anabarilius grahami]
MSTRAREQKHAHQRAFGFMEVVGSTAQLTGLHEINNVTEPVNEEPRSVARSEDRLLTICQPDLSGSCAARDAVNEVSGTYLQRPGQPRSFCLMPRWHLFIPVMITAIGSVMEAYKYDKTDFHPLSGHAKAPKDGVSMGLGSRCVSGCVLRATLGKPSCPEVCRHLARPECPPPSQYPRKTKANCKAQGANSGHPNCLLLPVSLGIA